MCQLINNAQISLEESVQKLEQLQKNTPDGKIIDADTILCDMIEQCDFEISGISLDIMNIWKNSTDKKAVEDMFYTFTDIKFKEYLEYCIEEMTKQKQNFENDDIIEMDK